MPIPVVPLSDTQIRKAKPRERTYKRFDGGGLYLEVIPSGSKLWRMKFRQASARKAGSRSDHIRKCRSVRRVPAATSRAHFSGVAKIQRKRVAAPRPCDRWRRPTRSRWWPFAQLGIAPSVCARHAPLDNAFVHSFNLDRLCL